MGLFEHPAEPGRWSQCFSRVEELPGCPGALPARFMSNQPVLIVPASDSALAWLEPLQVASRHRIHLVAPSRRIRRTWMEKTHQTTWPEPLKRLLNPPRSALLAEWRGLSDMTGSEGWIIKPDNASLAAARSGVASLMKGAKALRVPDFKAVEEMALRHGDLGKHLLVQEFIPGSDQDHAFCGGYVDKYRRVTLGLVGRKLRQFPPGVGVAIQAKKEFIADVAERSVRFVKMIGARGFFEVEWKWDGRRDAWRFLEVNLRPWGILGLSVESGKLLARAALLDHNMLSDVPTGPTAPEPDYWVDDLPRILVAARSREPGRKSRVGPSAHAYWSWRDPLPFAAQCGRFVASHAPIENGRRLFQSLVKVGKDSIYALCSSGRRPGPPSWGILAFHRVVSDRDWSRVVFPQLAIRESAFEAMIQWLKDRCEIVTLDEGYARAREGRLAGSRPVVSLTFDDGYKDNVAVAAPILARHRAPATLYLATGYLDGAATFWWDVAEGWSRLTGRPFRQVHDALERLPNDLREKETARLRTAVPSDLISASYLSPPDLKKVVDLGFELGNHTASHPYLDDIPKSRMNHEIRAAHQRLRTLLGWPARHFSFPNGRVPDATDEILVDLGYDTAVTTEQGLNYDRPPRYRLKRIDAAYLIGRSGFSTARARHLLRV